MINHLLNMLHGLPGDTEKGPGWEPVPADFAPAPLPGAVQPVDAAMFGEQADIYMRRYRAHQINQLVYADPSLRQYAVDLDVRCSCVLGPSWKYPSNYFDPVITYDGSDPAPNTLPRLFGEPKAIDGAGHVSWNFFLFKTNSTSGTIQFSQPTPGAAQTLTSVGTDQFAIPGLGLRVWLPPDATDSVGWQFELKVRPSWSWRRLEQQLRASGSEAIANLFSLPAVSALRTVFDYDDESWRRVCAAGIALAYSRSDAQEKAQG